MRCYKKVQQVNKWIIWLELRALEIVSYQNVACDRRTMMIADDCWWFTIALQHEKLLFATALAESQHLSLSISLAMCERDKAHHQTSNSYTDPADVSTKSFLILFRCVSSVTLCSVRPIANEHVTCWISCATRCRCRCRIALILLISHSAYAAFACLNNKPVSIVVYDLTESWLIWGSIFIYTVCKFRALHLAKR